MSDLILVSANYCLKPPLPHQSLPTLLGTFGLARHRRRALPRDTPPTSQFRVAADDAYQRMHKPAPATQ